MASRFAKIMLGGMVGLSRFQSRIGFEISGPTRRGLVWHHEEADEDPEYEWAIPKLKSSETGWVISFDSLKPVFLGGDEQAECVQLPAAGIEWQGVEVVSKILTAGEALKEAGKVASLLGGTFRTEVNGSCGLHVHIGNGKASFNLSTLKNLVGALWVFDREIIRLHPRIRTASRLWTACCSFCAGVLGRFPRKGIEFCQHGASLDGEKVVRWARSLHGDCAVG